jgi:DNA-binding NtrC family response regulator
MMEEFTVLLVDDQTAYYNSLEKELATHGLKIRRANDSDTALGKVEKHEIDVVILDVTVPEIDGIELLRCIKAKNPLLEVILLAGQTTDLSLAIRGMEMGAFDVLFKSNEIDALFYKLKDAYEKKTIQEEKKIKIRNELKKKEKEQVKSPPWHEKGAG